MAEGAFAQQAFADMGMSINPRTERRLGIIEVKSQDLAQTYQGRDFVNRAIPARWSTNIIASGKEMRRIQT